MSAPHLWTTFDATNTAAMQDDGGMRLMFVFSVVKSTSLCFMVNKRKTIVLNVLAHTSVWAPML